MFKFAQSGPVVGKADVTVMKDVESVFRFVSDDFFRNYPRWSPEVEKLEPLSEGPLKLGSVARQVRTDQGHRTQSTFRVIEHRVNERVAFKGTSDPYRCTYEFRAADPPPSTRLTFTFELSEIELFMRPFEKLIRVAIQDGAQRTVRNIKNLLESPTSDKPSDEDAIRPLIG